MRSPFLVASLFAHEDCYETLRPTCPAIITLIAVKMSENVLFENSFKITEINSAKYDRVSRIKAFSEGEQEVLLHLDVNTELYPLNVDDRMTVALALSLNLDGSKDDGKGWREIGRGEQTLADEFDYVCHGKIYRFEEGNGDNM